MTALPPRGASGAQFKGLASVCSARSCSFVAISCLPSFVTPTYSASGEAYPPSPYGGERPPSLPGRATRRVVLRGRGFSPTVELGGLVAEIRGSIGRKVGSALGGR